MKEESLTENYEYELLQWYTHYKGEKILVELGNEQSLIVRYLKLTDKEKKPAKKWPIIDRSLFPISHDWDGVSIPDLVEDKQRARAVLLNLGLESAIQDVMTGYLYNVKKIKNPRHLKIRWNKKKS